MNNDTEKADELLQEEISRVRVFVDCLPDVGANPATADFRKQHEKTLAWLEAILKDREALKNLKAEAEALDDAAAGDGETNAYCIHPSSFDKALASQTETIIKTLS